MLNLFKPELTVNANINLFELTLTGKLPIQVSDYHYKIKNKGMILIIMPLCLN